MTDNVNHPSHYECENVTLTIEPIELCEQCGFLLGNALKYLFRYQHKGKPLEDLRKAEFYLKRWVNSRSKTTDFTCFDPKTYIFEAFKNKAFLVRWDAYETNDNNVTKLLKWTQEKIKELEGNKTTSNTGL